MGVPTPQYSASATGRFLMYQGNETVSVDAATASSAMPAISAVLYDVAQSLSSGEKDQAVSNIGLPGILGAWTAYTPSVSAGVGSFGSASATGRYLQVGKTVFFNLTVTIVSNGTAAAYVSTTLPVACKSVFVFFGREDAVTGAVFQAKSVAASTGVNMFTFSNTYPGGNGYQLVISGSYEAN